MLPRNYLWLFAAPNGQVFHAGPEANARYFSTNGTGSWGGTAFPHLNGETPGYGTAVLYGRGKILAVGGGRAAAEKIDLTVASPAWSSAGTMSASRDNQSATLLPDGAVLVTDGSSLNITDDYPAVLEAELWTPPGLPLPSGTGTAGPTGHWTMLAPAQVPRLYHSTAVLLPDGRVLTTGGGQGGNYADHRDYEVFSPPYLFKGARPTISAAPVAVKYGQNFTVTTPNTIQKVRWIRLGSATHANDMNQRLNELTFTQSGSTLTITPPVVNDCPPGHYMLFVLDAAGVPSEAKIIAIDNTGCATPVNLTLTVSPQGSTTGCTTTRTFTATGNNLVTSSIRWSINGIHQPGGDGLTAISLTQGLNYPYTWQHQVSVTALYQCGTYTGNATTTQQVISYFPNRQPE